MTAESNRKARTITLTDRPPVSIWDDEWGALASATDCNDRRVPSQASRTWTIRVRQHDDGRTIVYGVHSTAHQSERDLRAGYLLVPSGEGPLTADDGRVVQDDEIVAAIKRVAHEIGMPELAADCIADLPAQRI